MFKLFGTQYKNYKIIIWGIFIIIFNQTKPITDFNFKYKYLNETNGWAFRVSPEDQYDLIYLNEKLRKTPFPIHYEHYFEENNTIITDMQKGTILNEDDLKTVLKEIEQKINGHIKKKSSKKPS